MDKILLDFMTNLKDQSDINYFNNEFVIKMNEFLVNHILTQGSITSDEVMLLSIDTRNSEQLFSAIIKSNLLIADDMKEIKERVNNSLKRVIELKQSPSTKLPNATLNLLA